MPVSAPRSGRVPANRPFRYPRAGPPAFVPFPERFFDAGLPMVACRGPGRSIPPAWPRARPDAHGLLSGDPQGLALRALEQLANLAAGKQADLSERSSGDPADPHLVPGGRGGGGLRCGVAEDDGGPDARVDVVGGMNPRALVAKPCLSACGSTFMTQEVRPRPTTRPIPTARPDNTGLASASSQLPAEIGPVMWGHTGHLGEGTLVLG